MFTYDMTKLKGVKTISEALMCLVVSNNHESNRKLIHSITEAARYLQRLEDLQESYERGDIQGTYDAKKKSGF